jgi:hypothetical protein
MRFLFSGMHWAQRPPQRAWRRVPSGSRHIFIVPWLPFTSQFCPFATVKPVPERFIEKLPCGQLLEEKQSPACANLTGVPFDVEKATSLVATSSVSGKKRNLLKIKLVKTISTAASILLKKSLSSLDFRLRRETWRDAFNWTSGVIGQLVAIDVAEIFCLVKSYVLLRIGRRHREAKNRD